MKWNILNHITYKIFTYPVTFKNIDLRYVNLPEGFGGFVDCIGDKK